MLTLKGSVTSELVPCPGVFNLATSKGHVGSYSIFYEFHPALPTPSARALLNGPHLPLSCEKSFLGTPPLGPVGS